MSSHPWKLLAVFLILIPWTLGLSGKVPPPDKHKLEFDGGPSGGTFLVFAEASSAFLNEKIPSLQISANPSGGSIANLQRIDAGKIDLALANAEDIERGQRGHLEGASKALSRVRGVAVLYTEFAHLAVLKDGNIRTLMDLKGKRVAVGTRGSGTWAAARRFFRSTGMWKEIKPEYVSFDLAVSDFLGGRVEAVWQIVGYPSPSLEKICRHVSLHLIDLGEAAANTGFFSENPYYSPGTIPAGTYFCVDGPTATFSDQAVLVASKEVDEEIIFQILTHLYSAEGIKHLQSAHPVARGLKTHGAPDGLAIPMHPGAVRFWNSRSASQMRRELSPERISSGPPPR